MQGCKRAIVLSNDTDVFALLLIIFMNLCQMDYRSYG